MLRSRAVASTLAAIPARRSAASRWVARRQAAREGGYQGRAGKLVDGCYSYWLGATAAVLGAAGGPPAAHAGRLRRYLAACCQQPSGGLRDKPSKPADFYHTNYCLLGLALADAGLPDGAEGAPPPGERLPEVSPLFGVRADRAAAAMQYFDALPGL